MRISDWSSDVCSSDLRDHVEAPLIIGPDSESEQWAGAIAGHIGAPHVVFTKTRRGDRDVIIAAANLSAWKGRTPVLVDDVISSGHTLANAAREIREQGFPAPLCLAVRSEERRVGKECVSTCRYRWAPSH